MYALIESETLTFIASMLPFSFIRMSSNASSLFLKSLSYFYEINAVTLSYPKTPETSPSIYS